MASAPPAAQPGHCQSCHSPWTHSQAPWAEGAGWRLLPAASRGPAQLHTQHGSWSPVGWEGWLLAAGLEHRSPGLHCSPRTPTPRPRFKALGTLKMSRRGEDLLPKPAVHLRAEAGLC